MYSFSISKVYWWIFVNLLLSNNTLKQVSLLFKDKSSGYFIDFVDFTKAFKQRGSQFLLSVKLLTFANFMRFRVCSCQNHNRLLSRFFQNSLTLFSFELKRIKTLKLIAEMVLVIKWRFSVVTMGLMEETKT